MQLMGLDIGTTSVGAVVIDAADGRVLAAAAREHHAALDTGRDWERVQDPEVLLTTVQELLAELTTHYPDIRGLGITGQMHGILYVDRAGQAVGPLITWQDQRGERLDSHGESCTATLAQRTGHRVATGFGLVTHYYNLRHGLVPASATTLCTIADYAAMRLTASSQVPALDPSQAAGLGLFDPGTGRFDPVALGQAGIEQEILPRVGTGGGIAGYTEQGMAVFSGPGDNQAGFLGAVHDPQSAVLINIGTSGQVSVFLHDAAALDGLETRPYPGGHYLGVGAALCGGKAYAVLEDFLRRTCRSLTGYEGPPLYAAMERLAWQAMTRPVEGEKLRVDTRFLGTRNEPRLRGAIQGISLDNFTPEQLIAGFLEGIADELGRLYEKLPADVRQRHAYAVGCGTGLRRNPALCKTLAERLNLPLRIPEHQEEAAVGAALYAGVGLGRYRDYVAAGQAIRYQEP